MENRIEEHFWQKIDLLEYQIENLQDKLGTLEDRIYNLQESLDMLRGEE